MLSLPTHHHIAKGLFTEVPFTWNIISNYQEKIARHTKRQKNPQFEETEQASEPDMTGMLE